jgi:hypothetical protein
MSSRSILQDCERILRQAQDMVCEAISWSGGDCFVLKGAGAIAHYAPPKHAGALLAMTASFDFTSPNDGEVPLRMLSATAA